MTSKRYMVSCALAALLSSGGGAFAAAAGGDGAAVATASGSDGATAAIAGAVEAAPLATTAAVAADAAQPVEEIVVTSQRRSESLEKVPMTVQAFSGNALEQLNVVDLEDLLKFTPNVTYATNGPGQGSIFMRGLSAGSAGNQSSATIAPFPNVALYLDDQSMQFPGRNVDIYAVDLERIEVLEGPQGTLFGGGAEAGALRYITNKPKLNVTAFTAEGMYGGTSGGGDNDYLHATLNVPIVEDKFAVRAVVYSDHQGGYIENVPSTFTRNNNDVGNDYFNIKPTNGKCPNGLPAGQAGLCAPLNSVQGNNYNVAGNNSNPVTYTGARLSALYQVNENWDVLLTESLQNLNVEGSFAEYPTGSDFQPLKPLQNTVFSPTFDHDNWENTAWTVRGRVDGFNLVYTGAYMLRHIEQQQDYSNYSRSNGGTYYECTGSGTGFGAGAPQCFSPVSYWNDQVRNTHISQEVRLSTPDTWRLRGLVGGYWEQYRIYDNMNFDYKSIPACTAQNLATALAGGPVCVGDTETAPGSTANDPGVRQDNDAFGEDTQRGYDQTAFFASFDFDVLPNLTITAGTRYYQYNEFEVGSEYYTTTACVDVAVCAGDNININSHHDSVQYKGFKSRYGINWRPAEHQTLYFLYSEGFRPGGFSRSSGLVAPLTASSSSDQYNKPNGYSPDSLTNYEVGWKSELLQRRLQINVSAYYMNWDNVQLAFFNPAAGLGNTTFLVNGPNYEIKGAEVQFVARPLEGLSLQGSMSYNDDTQSNSPCLVSNVATSPTFGKCITQVYTKATGVTAFENPFGSIGSVPAFSPEFQANLRGRYDFPVGVYKAFVAADANYTGSMYNQPATYTPGAGVLIPGTTTLRYLQAPYAVFDASIGVSKDRWRAEFFCNNLLDSHASTFTSSAQFIKSEVPLRPRIFGLKIAASY